MNYYIDFDNTLYECANLIKEILEKISDIIAKKCCLEYDTILNEATSTFDSTNGNIFVHAEEISKKYGVDSETVITEVKEIINNGAKYVYDDSISFLKKLKENGNVVILLTFLPKINQEYQLQKINGSGLARYFDTMIFTTQLKYNLDLNYENGVFIDDNPKELEGFHSRNPLRLIRIRRPNYKRSKIDLYLENMEEYKTFDDIPIDFNK